MFDNFENDVALFDSRLTSLIIRNAESNNFISAEIAKYEEPWVNHKWKATGQQEELRIATGSLNVLLGKNGSGKSRLIDALRQLNNQGAAYVSATAIFDLPRPGYLLNNLVEEGLADIAKPTGELPDGYLTNSRSLLSELVSHTLRDTSDEVNLLKSNELFGISDLAQKVAALFEEVEIRRVVEGANEILEFSDFVYGFIALSYTALPSLSWRPKYFSDIFFAGSQVDGRYVPEVPVHEIDDKADVLIAAASQFLRSDLKLEYLGNDYFRLLLNEPVGGFIDSWLQIVDEIIRTAIKATAEFFIEHSKDPLQVGEESFDESVNSQMKYLTEVMVLPFPLGLLERCEIAGKNYVTSSPFKFKTPLVADGSQYDQSFWELSSGLSRWEIIDISGDDEAASAIGIQNFIDEFLKSNSISTLDIENDEVSIAISNFKLLKARVEEAGKFLSNCEVGVGGLNIRWSPISRGLPPFPRLYWYDKLCQEFLTLEMASKGQLSAINAFLRILCSRQFDSANNDKKMILIIGDEFDRGLHPNSSNKLLELLSTLVNDYPGVTAILSTHGLNELSRPSLRGANRIYVVRELNRIATFKDSNQVDFSEVSEILGTSFFDSLKFARLHILVEGDHDELLVTDLLERQSIFGDAVNIVNGRGLYAWSGIYANTLKWLSAPILLVHDKRDIELESAWRNFKTNCIELDEIPSWSKTKLSQLLGQLNKRKFEKKQKVGDSETHRLLLLLREVVQSGDAVQIGRIHLRGLVCEDIVDLLPIKCFPKLADHVSWESAHEHFRKIHPHASGEKFKSDYGINTDSVKKALLASVDNVHEELQRLYNEVKILL